MKEHVWKPTNPKFQLIWTFSWRVMKMTLRMRHNGSKSKYRIFIFVDFSGIFLRIFHCNISKDREFFALSNCIERYFLHAFSDPQILDILGERPLKNGVEWQYFNWKSVKKGRCHFFDSRFWKSIKNCIEWYIWHFYNSLIWYLIFRRNSMVCIGQSSY